MKQQLVLGALIAVVVCCSLAKHVWEFRQNWRTWAVLTTFLVLHFAIVVPAIARLGLIRAGRVEEFYLFAIWIVEWVASSAALVWTIATVAKSSDME